MGTKPPAYWKIPPALWAEGGLGCADSTTPFERGYPSPYPRPWIRFDSFAIRLKPVFEFWHQKMPPRKSFFFLWFSAPRCDHFLLPELLQNDIKIYQKCILKSVPSHTLFWSTLIAFCFVFLSLLMTGGPAAAPVNWLGGLVNWLKQPRGPSQLKIH